MTKLSACLIICILTLNGCTIEKRKYSSGYHTTWNVQHLFPKGNSANQSQREESKPSFSPKLNSKNEYALLPIFSDSTKNQESENLAELSIASKKKTQRLASSVSDTVPEVKKKEDVSQNKFETYDQLEKDRKHLEHSWLGLLISVVAFIGSIPIISATDAGVAYALLILGMIGGIISIILIISFTIIKNSNLKHSYNYTQKKPDNSSEIELYVATNKDEAIGRLQHLKKKLIINGVACVALGFLSVLTFTSLFAIGLLCFLLLAILKIKRNKLVKERNALNFYLNK